MSLCPQPLPPVPDDTARIARAAFWRGNPHVLLRDRLGAVFADADFADLSPKRGQHRRNRQTEHRAQRILRISSSASHNVRPACAPSETAIAQPLVTRPRAFPSNPMRTIRQDATHGRSVDSPWQGKPRVCAVPLGTCRVRAFAGRERGAATMGADEPAWLASALAFAVSMSCTPGPNNAMVAASGATWGLRRTLPHMLGVSAGFPAMLVAVALGAGELLRARPWLHEALRWLGVAYLVWLAWHIATAQPAAAEERSPAGPNRLGRRPLTFVQAALFQWVNPKAWVIAFTAVVTYTTASGGALVAQAALLAAIFLVIILPTTLFWTTVGVGAARLLRTRQSLRTFNIVMAALLIASLLPLLRGE